MSLPEANFENEPMEQRRIFTSEDFANPLALVGKGRPWKRS